MTRGVLKFTASSGNATVITVFQRAVGRELFVAANVTWEKKETSEDCAECDAWFANEIREPGVPQEVRSARASNQAESLQKIAAFMQTGSPEGFGRG